MGHEEIEQQIENLRTELLAIEDVFENLRRAHESDKQKAAWDLSTKTQMALTATMILTMRIGGQFDPNERPVDFSCVVGDLETCWREARESADAFLKGVSSTSVNLIKLHDSKVVLWHRSAEMLRNQLKKNLDASQEALQQEKSQLRTLNLQSAISQKKLSALQQRSPEAQSKFDDLNKWLWNSPETRLLQQSFKIVIESLKHEIESAKKNAESVTCALEGSQAAVAEEEAIVRKLASASQAQIDLLTQGAGLLDKSTAMLEEVKSMQQEVTRMRNDRHAAWELVFHIFDRSRHGEGSFSKAEYARLILQVVEASLNDTGLHLTCASIVNHLARNDDAKGSVRGATGGGRESLLTYLQEKLGLPEDQGLPSLPPRPTEHTMEETGNMVMEKENEVVNQNDDDESDSDWDKISVPFKPYGDFDRSSIRIALNIKDTFPIADAGVAPCRDKDGSPVYFASAIGVGGGKHPCKYAPSLQPTGCRVPYGGEEVRHVGDYEVLPYIPELMEFAEAENGQVPVGRRGVVGGHEEGGVLYHAISEVEGVWVPGKTGEHIRGATVAYGDVEHHSTSYKILQVPPHLSLRMKLIVNSCWKE